VLAAGGRFLAVLLPVYGLTLPAAASLWLGLGVGLAVTAAWFTALQKAAGWLGALRASPLATTFGVGTGLVAVSAVTLWLPGLNLGPRLLLEIAAVVFVLVLAWDGVIARTLGRSRVVVVGTGPSAERLYLDLAQEGGGSFEIVGFVSDPGELTTASLSLSGLVLGDTIELRSLVRLLQPDLVVLATKDYERSLDDLLEMRDHRFRVVNVVNFYEHAFGRVPLQHLTPTWFWSLVHLYQRPYERLVKRAFDISGALFVLIATAPLWPVIALLVRTSKGPILFRQTRVGAGGEPFTMFKFRTMRKDAEASGLAIWAEHEDPRVTRVGRWLRRMRLDELPQVLNVLRGNMSLVGPRPERPEFEELLSASVPYWTRRQLTKPGITGWAQVRTGYARDCDSSAEKLSYDLWYLRHRTVALDLAICAKTALILLFPRSLAGCEAVSTNGHGPTTETPRELDGAPDVALELVTATRERRAPASRLVKRLVADARRTGEHVAEDLS
jgi:exopolysaccharide biosynthesis polyprenyl glycosylphosphotransferase